MIQNKKLYVFDLGGVTLDHVDIMAEWVSKIKVDKDEFYKTYSEYVMPIMDGTISAETFYRHLERYFGIKIEGEPFLEFFHPVLNIDVADTIIRLRNEGNRCIEKVQQFRIKKQLSVKMDVIRGYLSVMSRQHTCV